MFSSVWVRSFVLINPPEADKIIIDLNRILDFLQNLRIIWL